MYYQESDSIASNNLNIAELVPQLDELLFERRGTALRLYVVSQFLDIDDDLAKAMLQLYSDKKVIESKTVDICKKCDAIVERDGSVMECDLCECDPNVRHISQETAFVPRGTKFESGDDLVNNNSSGSEVEGVHPVIGTTKQNRSGDVVFIHGLDGNATSTWHPKGKEDAYWPLWIGEDIPNAGVWAIEYEAKSTQWKGDVFPLIERSHNCLESIVQSGIGSRPLIFITHSLGGLLAKQMLRHASEGICDDWTKVWDSCCGIVFLATPHLGSHLAQYTKYMYKVLRPTVLVDDLKIHDHHLKDLNTWFRNNIDISRCRMKVFYEKQKTYGLLVVDELSSDPSVGGIVPIPIPSNHIDICKPSSRKSLVYVTCKNLIEELI